MPGYDPSCGIPYAKWLQNKGVNANRNGLVHTERVVAEGVIPNGKQYAGERYKTVQDELGNRVRERSMEFGVSTGQDVKINAPCVVTPLAAKEARDGVA